MDNALSGSGGVERNVVRNGDCGNAEQNSKHNVKRPIRSYEDLEVYKNSYKGMLIVFREILPILPKEEKYDLADQLRRSTKAIPRLIAEGHAKRHQKKGFQKYIDDAHAESNETIVSLNQVKDIYASGNKVDLCIKLIDLYDKISRQLFKLSEAWSNYHFAEA
jgi:four helix bundle protein